MKRSAILFGNEELAPGGANPYHRDHRQGTNRKDKGGKEVLSLYGLQKCVK